MSHGELSEKNGEALFASLSSTPEQQYIDAVLNGAAGIIGADIFPSEWHEGSDHLEQSESTESNEMDEKE